MQSDMNVLRSSAFIPFDFVLQAAILLSDSFFLFDRHVLMNFLRSSPFLSAASLLHAVIRSCCALAPNVGTPPGQFNNRGIKASLRQPNEAKQRIRSGAPTGCCVGPILRRSTPPPRRDGARGRMRQLSEFPGKPLSMILVLE